jgi:Fe-S-cluster-containing dehydrogenase component/formate-dependent nitrite reductase membrane component NrfD
MQQAILPVRWLKVLDQTKCIGCHACTTACKSENEVPVGVTRTYVKSVDVGFFPEVRRVFQVTRCNQCSDAPCTLACPTRAMFRRQDGIVDFDKSACIGCKACMAACPYDAIFINPQDHSAEKCNLCAHRLEIGLEPACVTVCPTGAIIVGDGNDPSTLVARILALEPGEVRRPEKRTWPGVHYLGAHKATLDPLAARRPDGGLYAWALQGPGGASFVVAGNRAPASADTGALLSYDVLHRAPWGWPVSLYTWTKSIAAGAFAVPVLLALADRIRWANAAVRWAAPLTALAFLAVTGTLLVADLKHPRRLFLIFTRRQWRSWLVRGAFVICAYGVVVMLYLVTGAATEHLLAWLGLVLGFSAAAYTAFLLRQARGRDLWQSRLLALQLAVQALLAGAATMLPVLWWLSTRTAVNGCEVLLAVAAGADVLLTASETMTRDASKHARLAVFEMTSGNCARFFWPGLVLVSVAIAAPWLGLAATPIALAGLLAHEHAFIRAGQSVPLA